MEVYKEYLKKLNESDKNELLRIAKIVKEVAPDAKEVISYGMPGFKLNGKYLLGFAAFKDHLSLFPTALPEELKEELKDYKTSKGTIQFTVEKPITDDLLRKIILTKVRSLN